jgi:predicted RNA-binding protein YlxR (DUF448 family)
MLKITIRTCISCRDKYEQKTLNRLQCIDKKLQKYSGIGRSFYICNDCLDNTNKLEKALYKHCRNKDKYIVQLKEIFDNGR